MDFTSEYNFSLTIHPTARSILISYWNIKEDEWDQFLHSPMGGYDEQGAAYHGTCNDMYEGLLEAGCWGYAGLENNEIHLWEDVTAKPEQVIWMIGHEVGHLIESRELRKDLESDLDEVDPEIATDLYEERIADVYGAVCSLAYRIFMYMRDRDPDTGEANSVLFH